MQFYYSFSTKHFGQKKERKKERNCYTLKINHKEVRGWWVLHLKNSLFYKYLFKKNHLKILLMSHFLCTTKKNVTCQHTEDIKHMVMEVLLLQKIKTVTIPCR